MVTLFKFLNSNIVRASTYQGMEAGAIFEALTEFKLVVSWHASGCEASWLTKDLT